MGILPSDMNAECLTASWVWTVHQRLALGYFIVTSAWLVGAELQCEHLTGFQRTQMLWYTVNSFAFLSHACISAMACGVLQNISSASFLPGTSRQMKKSLAIFSYLDIDSNRFTCSIEGQAIICKSSLLNSSFNSKCIFWKTCWMLFRTGLKRMNSVSLLAR